MHCTKFEFILFLFLSFQGGVLSWGYMYNNNNMQMGSNQNCYLQVGLVKLYLV